MSNERITEGMFVEFELSGHPDMPQGGTVRGRVIDAGPDRNPAVMVKGLGQVSTLRSKLRPVPCLFAGDYYGGH